MSSSDIAVAVSDARDRMVLLSPGFKTIFGDVHAATVSELTEMLAFFDEKMERRLALDERPLTRAARGEVVRDLVVTARHTDGTWRYFRFNTASVRGAEGEVLGRIGLGQDTSVQHGEQPLAHCGLCAEPVGQGHLRERSSGHHHCTSRLMFGDDR